LELGGGGGVVATAELSLPPQALSDPATIAAKPNITSLCFMVVFL
jgi:hypothetical protein